MQLWCDHTLSQGRRTAFGMVVLGVLAASSPGAIAQDWPGHARDSQHTALSRVPSQVPETIRWSIPVDLEPQYSGGELLTHYGSPLITELNTVLVPVKTGETSGFRIVAVRGHSGEKIWSLDSDYTLPPFNWIPAMGTHATARGLFGRVARRGRNRDGAQVPGFRAR